MNARRGGLGRGLGALIPTVAEPVGTPWSAPAPPAAGGDVDRRLPLGSEPQFADIPVAEITPNPRQPRQHFDPTTLADLVASIRAVGLLQPVIVRPMAGGYELVMGERRWRAAQSAGLATVPAVIRMVPDDALLRDALIENLHREQLNPLEEAAAYGQLLEDFHATHEELATRVGRSRPHVTNTLRLLQLPPAVQRRVAAGVISAGHARALLAVPDPAEQEALASRIVAEGLSVRAVEEAVSVHDRPAAARRPRRPAVVLDDLAGRLSDRFDTRVKVELGRSKGRIVVEFASVDDLARIVDTMAPGTTMAPDTAMSAGVADDDHSDSAVRREDIVAVG